MPPSWSSSTPVAPPNKPRVALSGRDNKETTAPLSLCHALTVLQHRRARRLTQRGVEQAWSRGERETQTPCLGASFGRQSFSHCVNDTITVVAAHRVRSLTTRREGLRLALGLRTPRVSTPRHPKHLPTRTTATLDRSRGARF